ncbi:MAG: SMC-Scp complex subunit ScpB [Ancrocorticia sp.]|uniref:SMC-Scp complex subunit ScpB n=1 Tax=Ancrocorticia sp. TaxID=2593684 RepID=UPI003F90C1A8
MTSNSRDRQLAAIEALLLVANQPIPIEDIARATGLNMAQVRHLLEELTDEYSGRNGGREHGFQLREIAGGFRLYTNPEYSDVVTEFVVADAGSKLSGPALETLAIIAYRQPVTRAQIAAIRGVNVDSVVRTLLTRGLVSETGASTTGATMYGTTQYFLESMGINSLEELAPLAPYLPEVSEMDEVVKELQ